MKEKFLFVMLFLASVFVSSVSQILLKKSTHVKKENWLLEYTDPKTLLAYFLFFASSLLTVIAYRGVPLSMGPVIEATGYLWVALLGSVFLKERISRRRLCGLMLILAGIMICNAEYF